MGLEGLEFHPVEVRFEQGLDTRTQQKLVLPGKWNKLENVSLSKDNTPRLRNAWTALNSAARPQTLATHDGELIGVSAGGTRYDVNGNALGVSNAYGTIPGEVGYLAITGKQEIRHNANNQDSVDCAYGSGLTCYVWRETPIGGTSTFYVQIADEKTGSIVLAPTALRTPTQPGPIRVAYSGGAFFIFYSNAATGLGTSTIWARVIDAAVPTVVGAEVVLRTAALTTLASVLDAVSYGSGTAIAFNSSDGTASVYVGYVTRVGTTPSLGSLSISIPTATEPFNAVTGVCVQVFPDGVNVCSLAVTADNGVRMTVTNAGGFVTLPSTVVGGPAAIVNNRFSSVTATQFSDPASNLLAVFSDVSSYLDGTNFAGTPISLAVVSPAGVSTPSTTLVPGATYAVGAGLPSSPCGPYICGKAVTLSNGLPVVPVWVIESWPVTGTNVSTASAQGAVFLVDAFGGIVARALSGAVGPVNNVSGVQANANMPCTTITTGADAFGVVVQERLRTQLVFGVPGVTLNLAPVGMTRLNFASPTAPLIKGQLGRSTFFAGGMLSTYDGQQIVEHGFHLYPEGYSVTAAGVGGSMTAGVHQVVVVYEWIDGQGQRHQSAPGLPVTVTTVGGDLVNVVIPTLLLTNKPNVALVPYCTTAGGTTFYRCIRNNGNFGVLNNDKTFTSLTFKITESDAQLSANEVLYTQPSQSTSTLPNQPPPPCNAFCFHQGRIFSDVADFPGYVRYSQQLQPNTGLQWNDALYLSVPADSGGIVGFAELDEKVVIFCGRRLYAVLGSGPNSAGGYSQYSDPTEIASDVGCVEARSILRMPFGVIFKAQKGWHMLGRDLSVKYIGEGVAAYDGNDVTAAILLEDRKEARFLSSSGVHLVFSYLVDQWSVSKHAQLNHPFRVNDCVWWPTRFAASGFGIVYTSLADGLTVDSGNYFDSIGTLGARSIVKLTRTGWIRANSLSGFMRARWLYLSMSADGPPTSTFMLTVDYDDAYDLAAPGAYSTSINLAAISFPNPSAVDLRHKLRRQKAKSFAFTFTESYVAGVDNPLSGLQSLQLQVGVKRGTNKLPAAQGMG